MANLVNATKEDFVKAKEKAKEIVNNPTMLELEKMLYSENWWEREALLTEIANELSNYSHIKRVING